MSGMEGRSKDYGHCGGSGVACTPASALHTLILFGAVVR